MDKKLKIVIQVGIALVGINDYYFNNRDVFFSLLIVLIGYTVLGLVEAYIIRQKYLSGEYFTFGKRSGSFWRLLLGFVFFGISLYITSLNNAIAKNEFIEYHFYILIGGYIIGLVRFTTYELLITDREVSSSEFMNSVKWKIQQIDEVRLTPDKLVISRMEQKMVFYLAEEDMNSLHHLKQELKTRFKEKFIFEIVR